MRKTSKESIRLPRLFSILCALFPLGASVASAAISWHVDIKDTEGNPFLVPSPGSVAVLDITLRSDGEPTFAVGASLFGYEPGSISLIGGTTSRAVLVQLPVEPGFGFGGIDSGQQVEEVAPNEIQFLNGVSLTGSPALGIHDISPITGLPCDPQFQIIIAFNSFSGSGFSIGTDPAFGDAVVGEGGALLVSNKATVNFFAAEPFVRISQMPLPPKVPEPSTTLLLGAGLFALASRRGSAS